ncbi:MAG: bifunctional phosphopantothenoylcysteine decarboxylase/phosphopantothenate--cysteine ligase CoaBC [Thermoplasmata archaeon]|nr:bifunctional phosphopantothenoylcysteine decarboxylase/phosphopantothenate--cysteine ligase CoaBC [Thermoplasmata archaeon]
MHPSKNVLLKDSALAGRSIVLGITGSIAAVEAVKLIRELLRHGAEVIPVMTPEATRIIHPNSIEFAAGIPPVTEITGQVEHVLYCGDQESAVDIVLIAPATANTISKIACGIDDTPVTTFATSALGTGIPLLIAPSMHGTMYQHPILLENMDRLKSMGIGFIEPDVAEGKAKMPSRETVVEHVIRKLAQHGNDILSGKRILIIGGSTAQPLDEMRVITNKSSGKTTFALAIEGFRRGAEVEVWFGLGTTRMPEWIERVKRFTTVEDLLWLVDNSELNHDAIILCAAISDYSPEKREGKIPSGQKEIMVKMTPTPKVIDRIREKASDAFLVGYKAEAGIGEDELLRRTEKRMLKTGSNFMVANLLEDVGPDITRVYILDIAGGVKQVSGTREDTSRVLFDVISEKLKEGSD